VADLVTFERKAVEELASLPTGQFDGVFSNFGVLNCVQNLSLLAVTLARLLKPGTPLVLCVMGRFCAWETAWYITHGNLRKAFRRLRGLSGEPKANLGAGPDFPVYYRSVGQIASGLQSGFDLQQSRGIGILAPPSCGNSIARKHPNLLRLAVAADKLVEGWPILRDLADHRLLVFRRSSCPPEGGNPSGTAPELRCPSCRNAAGALQSAGASCSTCGFRFEVRDGIVRALAGKRREFYAQFAAEYCAIRKAEGRGSEDAAYYRALPYRDLTGRNSGQWGIRARTYRYFEKRLLPRLEQGQALDILDLGAGTGWFSYRMAKKGHRPVAVDLLPDRLDGLGAARHFQSDLAQPFPCLEAEFDDLPFGNAQFDLAVFGASAHYSTDCFVTFAEALRCLRPSGALIIMDSPIYRLQEHGERMREERHRFFGEAYGFRSDSVPSREYLDDGLLRDLARALDIRWDRHRPWYGPSWHLRPLKARLTGGRPPSRFHILVGRRSA
jgi:ubiquinone/menaquinone biosynthesis C-methylase UbiE